MEKDDEKLPSVKKLQAEIDAMKPKYTLPTLNELHGDQIEVAGRIEALNGILNHKVPTEWIKEHPYIKGWKYLPIDKTELLLRKIFKKVEVEIQREGVAFNGVYVVVRVHYLNPATGEMLFHDGIGACQMQTKKDTSPADLMNINNGALSMAFPIAKSLAVKDACDHFGNLFGANLNRKDVIPFQVDGKLMEHYTTDRFERALDEN